MFVNGNDFDISSVWESSVKTPCLDKYEERGKLKGAVHVYIVYGEGGLFFFRGGIFRFFLGGREVGPVVTNEVSGGGCLPIREIIRILQSHKGGGLGGEVNFILTQKNCSDPTLPAPR